MVSTVTLPRWSMGEQQGATTHWELSDAERRRMVCKVNLKAPHECVTICYVQLSRMS
jgi:hypothetical protein